MAAAFAPFDLLVTPTLAFVAPPADVDEIAMREGMVRLTFPFNVLGWPALALPCGPPSTGSLRRCRSSGSPGPSPWWSAGKSPRNSAKGVGSSCRQRGWHASLLPFPALAALALVLVAPGELRRRHANARSQGPTGLHAFLLRADETVSHDYSRTPSFAWLPVAADRRPLPVRDRDVAELPGLDVVFKDVNVPQPAETVPRQLPWLTG